MRWAFVMLVLASALCGCTMTKKIGQVIADPDIQVGDMKEQLSELIVTLLTEPDINLNGEGEAAPVDVQLVYLSDDSKLQAADYDLLATTALPDALGKNYLDHQDFTLLPDTLKTLPAVKLDAKTQFIGIVAYFSDDQTSEWKQTEPVEGTGHHYRLLVHVRQNSIGDENRGQLTMATMKNRVLWQEGMFALPQHFQQLQRHNDAMLCERLEALGDFAWGFTALSLNTELLAQGKVMIDRAAGCMPDGTVFRIPDRDLLPLPFQPGALTSPGSHDIYLALPVAAHNISEVQGIRSAGQSSERYSVTRTDVRDVHSSDGDVQSLVLGQLAFRIVSGAEDLSAMVVLPLCRIRSSQPGGAVVLDEEFIPTCQTLRVSPVLNRFAGDVQGMIATRAVDLAKRIGSPEQSGIADVAEFMMLQLLNRSQMHFSHRARLHTLHPEIFYLDLTRLLGELMTFTENNRLPCEVEPYDHRDLTLSFKTVIPELRRALNIVLQPRAQNLPLIFTEGIYLATVNDPGLLQSGAFVLAVRARMPHSQLILQFTQQSKIAATDKIRNMVSVQVPGIPLRALPAAPRQLPYHDGYVYFELEKGSTAWQDVVKAGALAMHISGTFPELDMQLWAIRG